MLWRIAYPLLFFLVPRFIPKLAKYAYLVWKLTFDRRVNILLRLLVPATALGAALLLRIPYLGIVAYLAFLALTVKALVGLAPREVVQEYAPWRAPNKVDENRGGKDSTNVVEGSYHMVEDEAEPTNKG